MSANDLTDPGGPVGEGRPWCADGLTYTRDHLARCERHHHPDCYQVVGVPSDLPPDLCDCRTLRMLDAVGPDPEVTR